MALALGGSYLTTEGGVWFLGHRSGVYRVKNKDVRCWVEDLN